MASCLRLAAPWLVRCPCSDCRYLWSQPASPPRDWINIAARSPDPPPNPGGRIDLDESLRGLRLFEASQASQALEASAPQASQALEEHSQDPSNPRAQPSSSRSRSRSRSRRLRNRRLRLAGFTIREPQPGNGGAGSAAAAPLQVSEPSAATVDYETAAVGICPCSDCRSAAGLCPCSDCRPAAGLCPCSDCRSARIYGFSAGTGSALRGGAPASLPPAASRRTSRASPRRIIAPAADDPVQTPGIRRIGGGRPGGLSEEVMQRAVRSVSSLTYYH